MSYNDWIDENNKRVVLEYKGRKYDFFIYEQIENNSNNYSQDNEYIFRASSDKESIGLAYSDIIKEKNYSFLFSIFSPNPHMLNNMFDLNKTKGGVNNAMYYWLDSETHRAVKQNIINTNFIKKDKDNSVQGVIGISYNLTDIELDYSNKYYDFVSKKFIIYMSLTIFISSLILYYSTNNKDLFKPLFLLISSNIYLTYFMSTTEGITNIETEQDKVKDINDGILSISFLVAVNIFILETLKKGEKKYSLHNESAFLFCVALILLLLALYKKSNYNKIDDIRENRIEKQFLYNLSIFINLFILVNYLLYVGKETKIIDNTIKQFRIF